MTIELMWTMDHGHGEYVEVVLEIIKEDEETYLVDVYGIDNEKTIIGIACEVTQATKKWKKRK